MLKTFLTTSLVTAALFFSGCGSDSEGESRLETQHMIDKGDYDGVILKLADKELKTPEDNLALAAAYMGRAGLSLSDLISVIGDSNGDFGSFIGSIDEATKGAKSPLSDLDTATTYYKSVVGDSCDADNVILTDTQKDICIYKGLSQTMGAATAMSYIADDIATVFDDSGEQDNKLTASTCAMQYAVDGNDQNVDAVCTIVDNGNALTFANEHTYQQIEVIISGESYEYLLTNNGDVRSTAVTKGYCTTKSFDPRVEDMNDADYTSDMHVCPVNEDPDAQELTTGAVMADALNNGIDSIGVAADDDLRSDIDDFKAEVLKSSGKENDPDAVITEEDIVNYLNDNNEE